MTTSSNRGVTNRKGLVGFLAPIVLATSLAGGLAIPAAAAAATPAGNGTAAVGTAAVGRPSGTGLKATMADRVYLLGGPSATSPGVLINSSAVTVAPDGTVYWGVPYDSGVRIYKRTPDGVVSIGISFSFGTMTVDQPSVRLAVDPAGKAMAAVVATNNTTGQRQMIIADLTTQNMSYIATTTASLGGFAIGNIKGTTRAVVSLNQQIVSYAVNANGTVNATPKVIAGTAGVAGFAGDGATSSTATKFNNPAGLAFDKSGALLIADSGNNRVRKIDGLATADAGTVSTIAGNGNAAYSGDGQAATDAALSSPKGVAVDANGNIYIADEGNSKVRVLDGYRVISTVVGSSQDPTAKLVPGVIAPNATLYSNAFVGIGPNGGLIFTSADTSASKATVWQAAPLSGIQVRSDVLPSWVGAQANADGLLRPRGDAAGRTNYSLNLDDALLPQLAPNADGTKWVSDQNITLLRQGEGGAPFTLTAAATGKDASHSNVSVEYWVTNPITFSNVLLLHDVTVTYKDPSTGKTYSSMLPNGLSLAFVRGYNQSYVAQSPDVPMTWGDFAVPPLKDAEGNTYTPTGTQPVLQGDWIFNTGLTLKPTYNQ